MTDLGGLARSDLEAMCEIRCHFSIGKCRMAESRGIYVYLHGDGQ